MTTQPMSRRQRREAERAAAAAAQRLAEAEAVAIPADAAELSAAGTSRPEVPTAPEAPAVPVAPAASAGPAASATPVPMTRMERRRLASQALTATAPQPTPALPETPAPVTPTPVEISTPAETPPPAVANAAPARPAGVTEPSFETRRSRRRRAAAVPELAAEPSARSAVPEQTSPAAAPAAAVDPVAPEVSTPTAALPAAQSAPGAATEAVEASSPSPRELRFSRELEDFRSAETLQVPEIRRRSRKARKLDGAATVREGSAGAAPATRAAHPAFSTRPTPARPSPARRSASVLGRTAVLAALAVTTVIAPISGQLTNVALASTDAGSAASSQPSARASVRPSSVAAAVLGSDVDLDESGGDELSNVPDAATLARIREAHQNPTLTCSSVKGASGDTTAFNTAPEVFYPMLPGTYTISSEYGYRIHPTLGYLKLHAGQDFAAPVGAAIYAVAAGTVTTAGMVDGTGTVTIRHEVGGKVWYSSYLHMYADGIHVKAGDTVEAGQHIAAVGNTGRSSGPHLHFEVRTADDTADESTVDPWSWLKDNNAVELTTDCS